MVLQPERLSFDGNAYDLGENPVLHQAILSAQENYLLRFEAGIWPQTLVYEWVESDAQ